MYKEYVDRIITSNNKEAMEKLRCVMDKAMEHIEECDEELYDKLDIDLYEAINGKTFTEEKAKHWVKNMEPVGQKYTMEECAQHMSAVGYTGNKIDFYIASNMMANDYKNIVDKDNNLAFEMAKDFLHDEDAVDGKLFCYWKYIVEK